MYKNKKIALIFFARSNSKRLKNKLFKKISNNSIITTCFLLTKKIRFIDSKLVATTQNKIDNQINYHMIELLLAIKTFIKNDSKKFLIFGIETHRIGKIIS